MADVEAGDPIELPRRKRLRVGHVSERGAINAVRTLLEAHGLVVDEVDGRSDYGRDLIVDLVEDQQITGAVIGIQVKGDRRFVRDLGPWKLPASPRDLRYWAESSVPILGVLWHPDTGELRWENLTAHARVDRTAARSPFHGSPRLPANVVTMPDSQVLAPESLSSVLDQMRHYVRRTAGEALLGLLDRDDEVRSRAVQDCWILGRRDARAFLLLRRCLPDLRGESLFHAVSVLSHLGYHPDIFWGPDNWVPEHIKDRVQPSFRWTPEEICDLTCAIEHAEEEAIWKRGGLGQCLWVLFAQDPELRSKLPHAIPLALQRGDLDAAFSLLALHQYTADDPLEAAKIAVLRNPALREHAHTQELMSLLLEFGIVDLF